jgi:hypothetical protein
MRGLALTGYRVFDAAMRLLARADGPEKAWMIEDLAAGLWGERARLLRGDGPRLRRRAAEICHDLLRAGRIQAALDQRGRLLGYWRPAEKEAL